MHQRYNNDAIDSILCIISVAFLKFFYHYTKIRDDRTFPSSFSIIFPIAEKNKLNFIKRFDLRQK